MKNVLFASTVLAAGAIAAPQFASAQSVSAGNADFSLGGYARYGLLYDDSNEDETNVTWRYRLQIDASTTSDAGVVFGARVRINRDVGFEDSTTVSSASPGADGIFGTADDDAIDVNLGNGGKGINAPRFFVRAGGLEVGVGNIFGALDSMPGMYPVDIGLTGHSYEYAPIGVGGFDAYSSGGTGASNNNGIEAIYSMGDFTVHASASDTNDRRAIHAAYSWNGWTFAIGAQDSNEDSDTDFAASVGGNFGPAFVNLAYAEDGNGQDRVVLAGRFDVGASTNVEAYILDDSDNGEGYGIDFNHSMGGGTSLRGGVSETTGGTTLADLGVRFDF